MLIIINPPWHRRMQREELLFCCCLSMTLPNTGQNKHYISILHHKRFCTLSLLHANYVYFRLLSTMYAHAQNHKKREDEDNIGSYTDGVLIII